MKQQQFLSMLFLACFITCTSTLFAQLKGDTYATAKSKGSANWVLTYSNAPGFASASKSGITYDIMMAFEQWIEKNKGINVSISHQSADANDFTKFLEKVKNSKGGVFGLSNTTITEARKKEYNFSPPYITNIGMIITHNSISTLTDLNDIANAFAGMTAVTIKNSTNEKRLLDIKKNHFPNLKIEYVPSFQQAMDIVLADPKKFTNVDFTYYLDAVQNRKPVKRHPGGDDQTEQFGIIMPKSNDWAPLLAEFMNEYVGSTEYKKVIMDNLGPSAIKFFENLK